MFDFQRERAFVHYDVFRGDLDDSGIETLLCVYTVEISVGSELDHLMLGVHREVVAP